MFEIFTNALFPDRCVGCGKRPNLLCKSCRSRLLKAGPAEKDFISGIFSYRDPVVKKLIWILKYQNGRRAAKIFAPQAAQAVAAILGEEELLSGEPAILIPIPLSKKRMKKRGYNQSELLAREIEKILRIEMRMKNVRTEPNLLSKIKDTIPQAEIKNRTQRLANQNGCFAVSSRLSNKETIILIDDVTTTGATMCAARKTLRAAGCRKVFGLAVAH